MYSRGRLKALCQEFCVECSGRSDSSIELKVIRFCRNTCCTQKSQKLLTNFEYSSSDIHLHKIFTFTYLFLRMET